MDYSKILGDRYTEIKIKAKKIKLILTDNDGVLTDTGVYYSPKGEEFKRFSIRDGMGVERLLSEVNIETGIITGETFGSINKRAEKLKITELYTGIREKEKVFPSILKNKKISAENIAYIGDDYNDLEIIKLVGLSACPADAMPIIQSLVDYICLNKGGNGAFRDFAELLIDLNQEN